MYFSSLPNLTTLLGEMSINDVDGPLKDCLTSVHQKLTKITDIVASHRVQSHDVLDEVIKDAQPSNATTTTFKNNLLSLNDVKVLQSTIEDIFFSDLTGCFDECTRIYFASKEASCRREYIVLEETKRRHVLLAYCTKYILPVFELPSYSPSKDTLYSVVTALLQLSFCPFDIKNFAEDKDFFRSALEKLLTNCLAQDLITYFLLQIALQNRAGKRVEWMCLTCNSIFVRRFLLVEKGVAMTLSCLPPQQEGSTWEYRQMQARLITGAKFKDYDLFFSSLGKQILELLDDTKLDKEQYLILCLALSQLCLRSLIHFKRYVVEPLIDPLKRTTEDKAIPTSDELTKCVEKLKKIYLETLPPSSHMNVLIEPILHQLFAIAQLSAACHLKSSVRDVIVRYLTLLPEEDSVKALLIMAGLKESASSPKVNPNLIFKAGPNVIIVEEMEAEAGLSAFFDARVYEETEDVIAECILVLLDKLKNYNVLLLFYENLVRLLDFSVLNDPESCTCNKRPYPSNTSRNIASKLVCSCSASSTKSSLLLTDSDIYLIKADKLKSLACVCNILNGIAAHDSLSESLFKDIRKIVPLIKLLLDIAQQECQDVDLDNTKLSLVNSSVVLLNCFISEQKRHLDVDDWDELKILLPSLSAVKGKIAEQENVGMSLDTTYWVEQIEMAILTKGVIIADRTEVQNEGEKKRNDKFRSEVSKTERFVKLKETDTIEKADAGPSQGDISSEGFDGNEQPSVSYTEALELLMSPHIALIANGILALSKLLKQKDKTVMENKERIYELFKRYLTHDDSYVYLMAVNGLATAADLNDEEVLPIICNAFASPKHPLTKAKIGEALTRSLSILGPLCSKHTNLICNTVLNGLKDVDWTVRTSSLSCLSQFCKESRFAICPIMSEIFCVLESVISTDKSIEVRRSAVMLIAMMLQGMGEDAFVILKNSLLSLYKMLKKLSLTEKDEVLLTHASIALTEIDHITKEYFMPKASFKKKIYITEVPPRDFM